MAVGVLSALSLLLIFLLIRVLIELKHMKDQLHKNNCDNNETQLTNRIMFEPLRALSAEINQIYRQSKDMKAETYRQRKRLKESIAEISHDLRTPLTVMTGYLEMIESTDNQEKKREYFDAIKGKTALLNEIINSFYELSSIENDSIQLKYEQFDLTELVINTVIDYSSILKKQNIYPEVDLPGKPCPVYLDSYSCRRIIENLISNAARYTIGDLGIQLYEQEEWYVLRISNHTSGLEKGDLERLFERFYRHDKSRHTSGSGLGLYIVKMLAEKMKIKVVAELEENWLSIQLYFENTCKGEESGKTD